MIQSRALAASTRRERYAAAPSCLRSIDVETEQLGASFDSIVEIGKQPFVRQIHRMRVLPVVMSDFVQALHDNVVPDFDREGATPTETARGKVDRTDQGGHPV